MKYAQAVYNAIALANISKNEAMMTDLNNVFSKNGETMTVKQLLDMPFSDFIRTNANEIMGTGNTGYGKEWVEKQVLSDELIDRLRSNGNIFAKATFRSMNSATLTFPVRWKKHKMVATSEATNMPNPSYTGQLKKFDTPTITLEVKTVKITVSVSDEWVEDAVINVAQFVLQEIVDAYDTTLHDVLLNGDTETGTNANINVIDGSITDLEDGVQSATLKFDGARKLAISKSATVDAGTNLVIENIRSARALMGEKGLNPSDLVIVPDHSTYFKLLNLSEVETIEKFGDTATIKDGRLVAIDGIEIINREEMHRANSQGKISKTATNNTLGAMALIHTPSLILGQVRNLTIEDSRYAEAGATNFTGSARVAIQFNDVQNSADATSPVALIVNI